MVGRKSRAELDELVSSVVWQPLSQMSVTDDQLRMNQHVYFAWVNKITLKGVGMTVIAVLAAVGGVFLWRRFAPK